MCRPHVIGGGPNVVIVGVVMGPVCKNPLPDSINEGGINQMICGLKEEYHDETGKVFKNCWGVK